MTIFSLNPYVLSPGKTYTYKITAMIPGDSSSESSSILKFNTIKSKLLVYIQGGNRLHPYQNPLTLEGILKDLDIPPPL